MAKNYIQQGNVLLCAAPYAVSSGDGALVGSIFGVAQDDAANAADVYLQVTGVYDLTKLSSDVCAVGDLLYWDNTNKRLTKTSSGNTKVGVCTEAAGNGVTTVRCRLSAAF